MPKRKYVAGVYRAVAATLFLVTIGLGNTGARLAQPKAQLPEQTLALTHSQVNLMLLRNPGDESFAIP